MSPYRCLGQNCSSAQEGCWPQPPHLPVRCGPTCRHKCVFSTSTHSVFLLESIQQRGQWSLDVIGLKHNTTMDVLSLQGCAHIMRLPVQVPSRRLRMIGSGWVSGPSLEARRTTLGGQFGWTQAFTCVEYGGNADICCVSFWSRFDTFSSCLVLAAAHPDVGPNTSIILKEGFLWLLGSQVRMISVVHFGIPR